MATSVASRVANDVQTWGVSAAWGVPMSKGWPFGERPGGAWVIDGESVQHADPFQYAADFLDGDRCHYAPPLAAIAELSVPGTLCCRSRRVQAP